MSNLKNNRDRLLHLFAEYKEVEKKLSTENEDLRQQLENQCSEIASEFFNIANNPESWINGEEPASDGADFEIASKFIYLIAMENCYDKKEDIISNLLHPLWRMVVTGSKGQQSWVYPYESLVELSKKSELSDNDIILGNIHEAGLCGGKIDIDKARDFYIDAEFEDLGIDVYNDVRIEYWGINCERNQRDAFNLLASKDQPLTPDVLNLLGVTFLDGLSTTRYDEMALEAFELGASFMYCRSLCNYGLMRYCGIGCTPDHELGKKLLELADFTGSEKAQKCLTDICNGKEIEFDIASLDVAPGYFGDYLKDLRQNADSGNLKANILLADIYSLPEVFKFACMEEAYKWYLKATRMGSLYAAIWMKDLTIYVQGADLNEVNELLATTDFPDSWIKNKISMTSMIEPYGDILELTDEEEELQRKRFCPPEALYWHLIERDDTADYHGWDDWLKFRYKRLSRFSKKLKLTLQNPEQDNYSIE